MHSDKLASLHTGLRENHRKLTRPRRLVLQVIADADHHLTPAEVFRKAKARNPRLGLTSVYRTLDLLVGLGYIQRIHLEEGCHSYAPIARNHGHHLVCSTCGRAEEFEDCDLEPLIKSLQKKTGYRVQVHMLELMGNCPSCKGKASSSNVSQKTISMSLRAKRSNHESEMNPRLLRCKLRSSQ